MNAQDFGVVTAPRRPGRAPKFRMTDAVVAVKGSGMQAEPRHLGRTGFIKGVHYFRGDTEHHYTVVFDCGAQDSVDERCLRR